MNATTKLKFTQRDVGIDLLRALTMFIMIFVNELWSVSGVPRWLGHAGFMDDYMGLADTVFPIFLFVVGMSIPYALERRYHKEYSVESTIGHILSRSFALIIMGAFTVNAESRISSDLIYPHGAYSMLMVVAFILVWNVYPNQVGKKQRLLFSSLKLIGWGILLFLAITFRDAKGGLFHVRWSGILGQIGWAYLLASMIYIFTRDNLKKLIPIWFFFLLINLLLTNMKFSLGGTAILNIQKPNILDDLLGYLQIGNASNLILVIAGVIFSILNNNFAHINLKQKRIYLSVLLFSFLIAGYVSHQFWPISKLFGTAPWIFYIIALAIVLYTFFNWIDKKGKSHWFDIIKPAGTATLTAYTIPYFLNGMIILFAFEYPFWLTQGIVGLIRCLAFAFVVIAITWLLGKLHIKLKI